MVPLANNKYKNTVQFFFHISQHSSLFLLHVFFLFIFFAFFIYSISTFHVDIKKRSKTGHSPCLINVLKNVFKFNYHTCKMQMKMFLLVCPHCFKYCESLLC